MPPFSDLYIVVNMYINIIQASLISDIGWCIFDPCTDRAHCYTFSQPSIIMPFAAVHQLSGTNVQQWACSVGQMCSNGHAQWDKCAAMGMLSGTDVQQWACSVGQMCSNGHAQWDRCAAMGMLNGTMYSEGDSLIYC